MLHAQHGMSYPLASLHPPSLSPSLACLACLPAPGSRRAVERRRRRQAEEAEDDIEREREAREAAAAAAAARSRTDAGADTLGAPEGTPGPAASSVKPEPDSPAPVAPSVDPSDPIYQAMLAAARAPPGARPPSVSMPGPPATGVLMQHAAVKQEIKQVGRGRLHLHAR